MRNLLKSAKTSLPVLLGLFLIVACSTPPKEEESAPKDFEWTTASEEALTQFETALEKQAVGNMPSSRENLTLAIEADPNFAMAYVFRSFTSGSAQEFAEDSRKAISLMEQLTEPEKIMVQVNQTYLEGDNEKREVLFKQLTDLLPESARAWTNRGADLNGSDVSSARAYMEKAISLDPEYTEAYTYAGNSYLNREPKDFAKAESMFRKVTELQPSMGYGFITLGDALRAQNKLDEAVAAYNDALALDPTIYTAYLKRGHVNSFLGNYEAARADYQQARAYDDSGNQGYTFEAAINLYAGDVDAAIEELKSALVKIESADLPASRIQSGKAGIANELGWITFHHKRLDDFATYKTMRNEMALSNAEDINTERSRLNTQANNAIWDGMELLLKGDVAGALAKSEEYKELRKDDTSTSKDELYHFFQGVVKYDQEDYEGAIASFQQANPDWIYRNYFLAKAMLGAGQEDQAKPLIDKVAKDNFNSVFYALVRNEMTELNESM